jgi:predicted GIY-YIG superfamily endonuclease
MAHNVLYRFFDTAGRLLYVGITQNPQLRLRDHRAMKDWWAEVANVTMEHFDSRQAVEAAERIAVRTENPVHNTVRFSQKRRRVTPPMVSLTVARSARGISVEQICEHLRGKHSIAADPEMVADIENGAGTAPQLAAYADALGISTDVIDTEFVPVQRVEKQVIS